MGGLVVNGVLEIINCPGLLVSTLRGCFDYVTVRFCGLLLGFVGDCMITHCYVSPPLRSYKHADKTIWWFCGYFCGL